MIDTTIYIGKLAIHEPVTVLTDFMISFLCFLYYYKIKNDCLNTSIRFWKLFYIMFGLSVLFGGVSHAFYAIHEGVGFKSFWLSMQIVNGFSVFFVQHATLNSVIEESPRRNLWKQSYLFQLFCFLTSVLLFQSFYVDLLHNAFGLIPMMVMHFRDRKNPEASKWIAYGVVISFLTAFVHGAKLSFGAYFNDNDISHVLIMCSLTVVYIGVRNFERTLTPQKSGLSHQTEVPEQKEPSLVLEK